MSVLCNTHTPTHTLFLRAISVAKVCEKHTDRHKHYYPGVDCSSCQPKVQEEVVDT